MASGDKSGGKTFTTGFTPVEIVVYNDSPADIYYADGLFSTKPGATIRIPPNTDMPIPYTQNAQGFTLFWSSTSALTQSYQIIVKWSDVPLAVPYTPLTQQVAVANSVTISVTQSGSWNVSINNQPTVNVNGPVSVQGITGGTAIGVSISSSVALNVQQSGTWTVDINTMPTVNINGPITVEGVSGGTAIGVQVQNDVTINGTVTVQFPSAQEVTLAATGPVNVTNDVLANNSAVYLGESTLSINLAAGAGVNFWPQNTNATGLYDGILLCLQTAKDGASTYTILPADGGSLNGSIQVPTGGGAGGYFRQAATTVRLVGPSWTSDTYYQWQGLYLFDSPQGANNIGPFQLVNATGSTLTDTVWVFAWAIKAQVSNPQGNPVQNLAASGTYDTLSGTNGGTDTQSVPGKGSMTVSLIASGGYAKQLVVAGPFTISPSVSGETGTAALYVGGQQVAFTSLVTTSGYATWQPTIPPFSDGVSNGGVSIVVTDTGNNSMNWTVEWQGVYLVTSSTTPPQEVTQVG